VRRARRRVDSIPARVLGPCPAPAGRDRDPSRPVRGGDLSVAKTPSAGHVVDLSVRIRPRSQLDDHSPAPPSECSAVAAATSPSRTSLCASSSLSTSERQNRPKLRATGRLFWVGLARIWTGWRQSLVIVTPDTVLPWQRRRFREYWTQLSGRTTGGRPPIKAELKGSHHPHSHREPALGRPAHPWRALEDRYRCGQRTVSRLIPKRRPQPFVSLRPGPALS
jgi:hypothetical protein